MPELENNPPERPTLTQKRTIGGNLPKINAFEKPMDKPVDRSMRLQSFSSDPVAEDAPPPRTMGRISAQVPEAEPKEGGSAKIVIWVVIVVALAVASYFALRNLLKGPSDNTVGPEPTIVETTIDPLAALVSSDVLPDVEASNVKADSAYSFNAQTIGTISDGTFTIDDVSVQKYTTFTRFFFQISSLTGVAPIPVVNAAYAATTNQITLTFANTTTVEEIPFDRDIMVNTNSIDSFTHSTGSGANSDVYVINLNIATSYVLQAIDGEAPFIVVDVKEVNPPAETVNPTVLPSATALPTATVTPTTAAGDDILDNAYSKLAQELRNGLTNNSADLGSTFKWNDSATEFNYRKPIIQGDGNLYPKVTGQLVGNTLEVEISNLKVKNATSSINFNNSKVVTKLDATRSGNSVKYVFTLTAQKDYRITFDQTTKELLIQVKH